MKDVEGGNKPGKSTRPRGGEDDTLRDHEGSRRHGHAGHSHAHGAFGHGHDHGHSSDYGGAFILAVILNAGVVIAEVGGGFAGSSVALVSDGLHNLSDVVGLLLAFGAHLLGRVRPSKRFTYGLGSTSIVAAMLNAVMLLVVTGALLLTAVQHLLAPSPVEIASTIVIALAAIVVNGLSAWLLMPKSGDLNLKAAASHFAADAAVAVGVVVSAMLIRLTGATWIDPVLSIGINLFIIATAWQLLRQALTLTLAGVPEGIALAEVRHLLQESQGVSSVHDLHVWPTSTSEIALTAHLFMPDGHPGDAALRSICDDLRARHGIAHSTLQVELHAGSCVSAVDCGV